MSINISNIKDSLITDLEQYYNEQKAQIKNGLEYRKDNQDEYYDDMKNYDYRLSLEYNAIIDDYFQKNVNEIDQYLANSNFMDPEQILDKEHIKTLCLKHYCTFKYSNYNILNFYKVFGVFIISNWYLNGNQMKYIE
jgi:hypothetical protein